MGKRTIDIIERISFLEDKVKYHRDAYYNHSDDDSYNHISDNEYDKLENELYNLDPNNSLFDEVSKDSSGDFIKASHIMPMGSQQKASTNEEFLKWHNKGYHLGYMVQYKLDGMSIELQYKEGVLVKGVTRGDGKIGDDITSNVMKMNGAIKNLCEIFNGSIRGEIIMTKSMFDKKYRPQGFKNCRNMANGLSKQKDGKGCEDLVIIVYDIWNIDGSPQFFDNEIQKLSFLERNHFNVVESEWFDESRCGAVAISKTVMNYRGYIIQRRPDLPYGIDGLVVKGCVIDRDDMQRARPMKQIAFKFPPEKGYTQLIDVIWSESGHHYTPVAIVEPVELDGSTVQRASLANPNQIKKLGLKIGDTVEICKRGDIIPHIEKVVKNENDKKSIIYPIKCDECGKKLINEGTRIYCPNKSCRKRKFSQFKNWIEVLGVKDFGDVLLRHMFNGCMLDEIRDLYRISEEDKKILSAIKGIGEKTINKAFNNLFAIKEISLPVFMAGFNIEGIKETIFSTLYNSGYNTFAKFYDISQEELVKIAGIGHVTAKIIVEGITYYKNEMYRLLSLNKIAIKKPIIGSLSGIKFCFTGQLESMSREYGKKLVEELGGIYKSSLTKDTTYLITNDPSSGSSKNTRALKYGTKIISEDEFREIVNY